MTSSSGPRPPTPYRQDAATREQTMDRREVGAPQGSSVTHQSPELVDAGSEQFHSCREVA
jgi:hypothetical protein